MTAEIFDYGKERPTAKGLLIAVGSGLLMASMDALPMCRYAVEYHGRSAQNPAYWDRLTLLAAQSDLIVVHGWFSISSPQPLVKWLSDLQLCDWCPPLIGRANTELPIHQFDQMQELIEAAQTVQKLRDGNRGGLHTSFVMSPTVLRRFVGEVNPPLR